MGGVGSGRHIAHYYAKGSNKLPAMEKLATLDFYRKQLTGWWQAVAHFSIKAEKQAR